MGKEAGELSYSFQKTKDSRIKKRGPWYWARWTKNGVRVEESLNTKSFSLAKKLCDEIELCIHRGVDWKKEHELFETAWPEFLEDKPKGIKTRQARPSTMKEYIRMGELYYMPFFESKRINDINEEVWEEFLDWLSLQTDAKRRLNHWKYFHSFMSWAFNKGKLSEKIDLRNPDTPIKDEEEESGPGKAYSQDELLKMIDAASGPHKLAVMMGIYMAMRSSEVTQLNKNRIDLESMVIRLRAKDTKIGRGRVVPIHPLVLEPLTAQISATKDSDFLFPNRVDRKRPMDPTGFKKQWNKVRDDSGVDGRTHDFKHSFITHALKAGMNVSVISKMVGTSIKVIERVYLHLTDGDLVKDLSRFELTRTKVGQSVES